MEKAIHYILKPRRNKQNPLIQINKERKILSIKGRVDPGEYFWNESIKGLIVEINAGNIETIVMDVQSLSDDSIKYLFRLFGAFSKVPLPKRKFIIWFYKKRNKIIAEKVWGMEQIFHNCFVKYVYDGNVGTTESQNKEKTDIINRVIGRVK